MTFLHLLVLAMGVLVAVVAADLLSHADIGPWPVGVVTVLLIPLAGWLYSAWLLAFTVGAALGVSIVLVGSWRRTFLRRRHARREMGRRRRAARAAQLGGDGERHP
ncbi:hypothetical protein BH708_18065 [Brachybacterium sp. P6-10-X1]|uniref:hypothetical protein n=1 Tax=Brachybacterium sp. P6-10-X1 TaxID=1903186 RepID=UPI0009719B63|nr:hypothetical protein [Brachybacterium sp. P6-10-X1]APX34297.1 hypothetical protein BH708_18065 [Brachybacterium sp. P6-10-X1]